MEVSKIIALVAPLIVVLSTRPALVDAQASGGPCKTDVQQFCPHIAPGPGLFEAVHQRVESNAGSLSLQARTAENSAGVCAAAATIADDQGDDDDGDDG